MNKATPRRATLSYSYFVLAMLFLGSTVSLIDRQILSILIEPIRSDLGLNDGQMGALTGLAFGLFYAVGAIPIARVADSSSRRNVIAACIAVWSIATIACGAATGFIALFIARSIVAVGEGGAGPASQSLLSDYFPPNVRASAMAIYACGIYCGLAAGMILGGFLYEAYGWRMAFYIVGLPGLILAGFIYLTVKEPPRGANEGLEDQAPPSLGSVIKSLRSNASLVHTIAGVSVTMFGLQAGINWFPAYFIRTFDLTPAEVGSSLGPITIICGIAGLIFGGFVGDKLSKRGIRGGLQIMGAISAFLTAPILILMLSTTDLNWALALYSAQVFTGAILSGPTFAAIVNLVSPRMRATVASITLLCSSLAGHALGPFVIGLLSTSMGNDGPALGLALQFSSIAFVWGAAHYLIAVKAVRQIPA